MDNEEQYGPEFHRLGFAEALDRLDENGEPLLSDYKVIILVMGEKQIARDYQGLLAEGEALADVGRVIGCLNGLAKIDPEGREFTDDPEPMHRAVAFSNTIAASRRFVDLVQREQDEAALTARNLSIEGRHVDGKTGVTARAGSAPELPDWQEAGWRTRSFLVPDTRIAPAWQKAASPGTATAVLSSGILSPTGSRGPATLMAP